MCALLLGMVKLTHDFLRLSSKRICISKRIPHSWVNVRQCGFFNGAANVSADTLPNPLADAIQHARCKVSRCEWNG